MEQENKSIAELDGKKLTVLTSICSSRQPAVLGKVEKNGPGVNVASTSAPSTCFQEITDEGQSSTSNEILYIKTDSDDSNECDEDNQSVYSEGCLDDEAVRLLSKGKLNFS